jgi:hypothetical protein
MHAHDRWEQFCAQKVSPVVKTLVHVQKASCRLQLGSSVLKWLDDDLVIHTVRLHSQGHSFRIYQHSERGMTESDRLQKR